MKKILLFLGIAIVTSHSLFAQDTERKSDFPVTKERLIKVLKERKSKESDIIETIDTNGTDFELTPEVEKELKKYHASSKILAAIPSNQVFSVGIVNGKAINLIVPSFPPAAKAVNASGAVNVQVVIDTNGNVTFAQAISGHPMLRQAAEQAALASKFSPPLRDGKKVRAMGIIIYNFAK